MDRRIQTEHPYPFHIMKAVDRIRPDTGACQFRGTWLGTRRLSHTKVEDLGGQLPRVSEDGKHVDALIYGVVSFLVGVLSHSRGMAGPRWWEITTLYSDAIARMQPEKVERWPVESFTSCPQTSSQGGGYVPSA
jgi:hypothetical protein